MVTTKERYNLGLSPLNSIVATAVTVGTSATLLPSTALANRRSILIYNNGSATIYVGGTSGVTTSSGMPVPANSALMIDISETGTVYAISGSAGQNVRVLEMA